MSSSSELETLVQQALVREKEQGTGTVSRAGHVCSVPTGDYNRSLPAYTLWSCSCGRKYRKQPERVYSGFNNTFRGVDSSHLYWQEIGLRRLARASSTRPMLQALSILLALVALLTTPVVLAVTVAVAWLNLYLLVATILVGGAVYLIQGKGARRWRAG